MAYFQSDWITQQSKSQLVERILQLLLIVVVGTRIVDSTLYKESIRKSARIESRQWGGKENNTGDNFGGWLVRVRCSGPSFISCVGAYYSPLMVITSGNCIEPFRYQSDGADVVNTAIAEGEAYNFSVVEEFYTPDSFIYRETKDDIAVAKLFVPLRGSLTEFIKLINMCPPSDPILETFGWGWNSLSMEVASEEPRSAVVTLTSFERCSKFFKKDFISNKTICAFLPANMDKCIYDGGSPLVWQNQLFGIASVGASCDNTSVPGVYTSVQEMFAFITQIQKLIHEEEMKRKQKGKRTTSFIP